MEAFLVPCEPLDHTWIYANEVTLGHSLDDLQDRGDVQKEQPHDWRVGILSQPNLQGGQWGLKTKFNHLASALISQAYIMETMGIKA